MLHLKVNDRWEVSIGASNGQFQHVSFVNGISTSDGGTHVNAIADQVIKALVTTANKANKNLNVKTHHVKGHIRIFVNALIINPSFSSQTKEKLTTKKANFGSSFDLPETFINRVIKAGVLDRVLSWASFKESKDLKKNDGKKRMRLSGVPKLGLSIPIIYFLSIF